MQEILNAISNASVPMFLALLIGVMAGRVWGLRVQAKDISSRARKLRRRADEELLQRALLEARQQGIDAQEVARLMIRGRVVSMLTDKQGKIQRVRVLRPAGRRERIYEYIANEIEPQLVDAKGESVKVQKEASAT